MLVADAVISVFLWKSDILGANRLIAPILAVVGWFMFVQSRADRFNDEGQCARCGCSVVDKETVRIKTFKAYDRDYLYCQRCGTVVAVERGLILGGPFALVAVFLDYAALLAHGTRIMYLVTISAVLWIVAVLFVRKAATMESEPGAEVSTSWTAVFKGLLIIVVVGGLLIALPKIWALTRSL